MRKGDKHMPCNQNICLTDRDRMEDILSCEKHLISEYSTFLPETTDANLRNIFSGNMDECAEDQLTVFDAMSTKGWYEVKDAQAAEVATVRGKFSAMQDKMN